MRKILVMLFIIAFVAVGCSTNNETSKNRDQQGNNQVTEDAENKEATPEEGESTDTDIETTDNEKKVIIAPDFELETLEGNMIKLSDLKDKNVIINFWATWCDFCVAEMPDLQKLQDTYKDDNLLILAINVGDSKEKVEEFMKDNNLSLTVLLDRDSSVANNYGLRSFPSTLAVNKDMEVVAGQVGMLTYEQMETMYGYFSE
nr:TlpA disulfide reductase family protein [Sedimentibacter sp.]